MHVRLNVIGLALALALWPQAAPAHCGTTYPFSYDDIEAVMLTQNGCGSTIQEPTITRQLHPVTFECSTFWVFFWQTGPAKFPTTYSQYSYRDHQGTFELSATLGDAVSVLKDDHFFSLSPPGGFVTDTAQSVLSVKRCAVVTKIGVYDTVQETEDLATRKLFTDIRTLITRSKLRQLSPEPTDFSHDGLFYM